MVVWKMKELINELDTELELVAKSHSKQIDHTITRVPGDRLNHSFAYILSGSSGLQLILKALL